MAKIFAISDGTGTTADTVARAALMQFDSDVDLERFRDIRSESALLEIIRRAAAEDAVIVHTLISEDLRLAVLRTCREKNVASVDLLGPLLNMLSERLDVSPKGAPGTLHAFDLQNVQRIEAINFAVKHDDGQHIEELDQAEIVLVGVSRTGKTPLSIYLAYRGWKVANVPLVAEMPVPAGLRTLPRKRVVGLVARPERLALLRQSRSDKMGVHRRGYANLDHVKKEIAFAYEVFDEFRHWPVVDVTNKSIEESASEIISLVGERG